MAGVSLTVESQSLDRLSRRLERIRQRFSQTKPLMEGIGAEIESQTRRRIADEKAGPDGRAWEPWSDNYAGRHSLLQSEGDLLDSLQFLVTDDTVEVGTNLIYAAIHQFGGDPVGIPIPAHPYLGLSSEDEADLAGIIDDWVDRRLQL